MTYYNLIKLAEEEKKKSMGRRALELAKAPYNVAKGAIKGTGTGAGVGAKLGATGGGTLGALHGGIMGFKESKGATTKQRAMNTLAGGIAGLGLGGAVGGGVGGGAGALIGSGLGAAKGGYDTIVNTVR